MRSIPAFLLASMIVLHCCASRPGIGKVFRKTPLQPWAAWESTEKSVLSPWKMVTLGCFRMRGRF